MRLYKRSSSHLKKLSCWFCLIYYWKQVCRYLNYSYTTGLSEQSDGANQGDSSWFFLSARKKNFSEMVDPVDVMSCLASISRSLASVECLKVLLGWDPVSNRDVGWLTVLGELGERNRTALAETGLVFREWNVEMGPYTGKGRLEKLEKLLHAVLETMPNR